MIHKYNGNTNLSGVVVEYIQEKILTGEYKEGERILEMKVAEELGISRAPVREGIITLQNQGLLNFVPRKGTFVKKFSFEDRKDVFEVRVLLENSILEILINEKRLNEEDFRVLKNIIDDMVKIAEGDDDVIHKTIKINKKDIEFHRYLWRKSGSSTRMKMLNNLHMQLQIAMFYDTILTNDIMKTATDHYAIIEYLRDGNLEKCKIALKEHIDSLKYDEGLKKKYINLIDSCIKNK